MTFNDALVRDFLIERLGAEPASIETLRPGEWSSAYGLRRGGEDLVVRFSRYRDDYEKDRAVAAHSSPALPVPEVLELGEAFDLAYAVTRRAQGEFLEGLDERRMRGVLPRLFAALDAARSVDLRQAQGFGLWTAGGGGESGTWRDHLLTVGEPIPPGRTAGWRERLAAWPTASAAFDEAQKRVTQLVEHCPEERHLVHDDLLNRNVLVSGDRITAVLDWGASIYGDFLYDIASLLFWTPWSPALSSVDVLGEAARHYEELGIAVPHFEDRMRCYTVRIGMGSIAYDAWKGDERSGHLARVIERTLTFARE